MGKPKYSGLRADRLIIYQIIYQMQSINKNEQYLELIFTERRVSCPLLFLNGAGRHYKLVLPPLTSTVEAAENRATGHRQHHQGNEAYYAAQDHCD